MAINLAPKKAYPFTIGNPVTGDDIERHFVPRALVVEELIAVKFGGTGTFDFELRFSANANDQGVGTLIHSDTGVNDETTGVSYTPPGDFAAVTLPARSWVWIELRPAVSTGLARPVGMSLVMVGVERGP